jgi:hypothetical protein
MKKGNLFDFIGEAKAAGNNRYIIGTFDLVIEGLVAEYKGDKIISIEYRGGVF